MGVNCEVRRVGHVDGRRVTCPLASILLAVVTGLKLKLSEDFKMKTIKEVHNKGGNPVSS